MRCPQCGTIIVQPVGRGRRRDFCSAACKMRAYRGHAATSPSSRIPEQPVMHHGRFQDYRDDYVGMIDVIITDLPYARPALPIYADLASFARAVLKPGGWLLCLTGFSIDHDVRTLFGAAGLEYLTVGCYHIPSTSAQGRKKTSTGQYVWQEHHKPLLWYQQPGTTYHRRRAGGNDLIEAGVSSPKTPQMNQKARKWEQSLEAFQEIVRIYTNHPDLICDPCAGWGTTLEACVSLDRRRCIGIEMLPERYAYACTRLAPLLPADAQAGQAAD